MKLSLLLLT